MKLHTAIVLESNQVKQWKPVTLVAANSSDLYEKVNQYLDERDRQGELNLFYNHEELQGHLNARPDEPLCITYDGGQFEIFADESAVMEDPLLEQFRQLRKGIPWFRLGDAEEIYALRQNLFGDILDIIRDNIGYKDQDLAFLLIGERAVDNVWDGLPSRKQLLSMMRRANRYFASRGVKNRFLSLVYDDTNGNPLVKYTYESDTAGIMETQELSGYEAMGKLEFVLEQKRNEILKSTQS